MAEGDGNTQNAAAAGEAAPPSSEDETRRLRETLDTLIAASEARLRPGGVWYFFSSGVFFMLVGAGALGVAYSTQYEAHSSFTFIMVVVGVAILLYGTGTQGAGNFDGSVGAARYRIGVAGGAGILAFAVAMGIVMKAPEIQRAFQIERKYVQLVFQGERDGISDLTGYVSDVRVNGAAVPTFRNGDAIVAFVPFLPGDAQRKLFIAADFYYVGPPESHNKALLARIPFRDELAVASLQNLDIDGGGDYPRYDQPLTIRMVADGVGNDIDTAQIAGIGRDPTSAGPNDLPAALTFAE